MRIPWMRRFIGYAIVLIVGILLGLVPTWFICCRPCSDSLAAAERQLNPVRIENALASAVIGAQRGDYGAAHQAASNFFTLLRAETDRGDASALSPAQREGVQALFAQQDEIITLLARSNSASAGRLSDLYVSYREILSK